MFPGAGAQVYYNEAGEPLGWDSPDQDNWEPDERLTREDYEVPDMPCGCFSDQAKHACDQRNGEYLEVDDAT